MIADLKFAFRSLGKRPGFTLIAITTLALGIGASTAIFSVIDAVLLRPLPYPQQERIVELRELDEQGRSMHMADPNFDDLQKQTRSFVAIARYNTGPDAVAGGREPIRTTACAASADFFPVLGLQPFLGRLFSPSADQEEKQVAVVSYGFWKSSLGGRSTLEGTTLRLEDHTFEIIGVLPPGLEFPQGVDVWFPASIYPPTPSRTAHNWNVVARLRDGVSPELAQAELASIGHQLKREYGNQTDAFSFGLTPLRERFVRDVRGILFVLCGAVGLLLLIAFSNAANLLLLRAAVRRKEIALRAALGASRARLIRQFVTESVVLTLIAGAAGVLLAYWGVDLIVGSYHGNLPHVGAIGVDLRVLIFAVTISLLVGVALGFVPALHAFGRQLQNDLQEAGRSTTTGRSQSRLRNTLIIVQVALTLLLLVGAGLLGRSFQRLLEVNPGFKTESAIAMTVSRSSPEGATAARQLAQFYHELIERIAGSPGVTNVGAVNALPLSGNGANGTFLEQRGGKPAETMAELVRQLDALPPNERARDADYRAASAGYFATMGIPLISGRVFQESDGPDSPHVAVVSQSFARRFWPNEETIGKQIQYGNMDGDLHLLNIVGIVGDVHDEGLEREARPTVYTDYFQRPNATGEFSIVARGSLDAASLTSAMRREARALDPEMPMKFETLRQVVASSLDNRRFSMVMLGLFAGAALILAMVGLYGIMAYLTAQRTTEIGIRMALGAQRGDMLRLVLRKSFVLVGLGIGAGILVSLAATRILRSMLYGVGTTDFFTYGAVVTLLLVAALAASCIPARRAMRVDPMEALRHE